MKPDFSQLIFEEPLEVSKETVKKLTEDFKRVFSRNFAIPFEKPFIIVEGKEEILTFTMPYKD